MLSQRYSRLCSKLLKVQGLSSIVFASEMPFTCVPALKGPLHTRRASNILRESYCRHQSRKLLSSIGGIHFTTASLPPLHVGAKVVIETTITADMVKCFAQTTGDWNPIHFDESKCSANSEDKSGQRRQTPIVHGALLNGIVSGVIGCKLPGPGTVVVSQIFKFSAPLPVGSQVAVEVEVLDCKRREVNVGYKVVALPSGSVVMDGTARLMVPKDRIKNCG